MWRFASRFVRGRTTPGALGLALTAVNTHGATAVCHARDTAACAQDFSSSVFSLVFVLGVPTAQATDHFVVELSPSADANAVAAEHGYRNLGQVRCFWR